MWRSPQLSCHRREARSNLHNNHIPIFLKVSTALEIVEQNLVLREGKWLRLCTSNAEGVVLIPGQGTKIPHAAWHGQKTKQNKTKQKESRLVLKAE